MMRKPILVIGVAALIVAGILALTLGLIYGRNSSDQPSTLYHGGIVTNGHECAEIGSSILRKSGSAMDAAIAALFCEGIAMPQSMGLGGGFLMTVYTRETKTVEALNARETAPLAATENMFNGNGDLSFKGGLSVAVPGELKGYWIAHKKYGKLPWKDLIQPTIDLCRKGHLVTEFLAELFRSQEKQLLANPTLREIYIDPKTNKAYKQGHLLKREKLAETLEVISVEGADALYNGSLTKQFINDIKELGGIITAEDMLIYEAKWETPVQAKLPFNQTLYSSPLPGSGPILTFIFNILNGFLDHSKLETTTNLQRIVESFKYGYGRRTELGDPDFVPDVAELLEKLSSETYAAGIRSNITDDRTFNSAAHYGANVSQVDDHGTAHISVLAPNGDAVSVTSTINQYFGAGIRSASTGIILNDEMDDFSAPNIKNQFGIPPSPANYIVPKKRPLSSMCPSIIVDANGDVVLVIGAAGGTKITTSIALVAIRNLWFDEHIENAIISSRLHHQLFPMEIKFEHDFNKKLVTELSRIGHNVTILSSNSGFAALTALTKKNGVVNGSADKRRSGQAVLI